jgi:membrane peptidoglycan carboxypeptidase
MVAAIEPGTGRVKALAANRDYGLNTEGNPLSSDPGKAAQGIKGTYPVTTNPILSGGGDIVGYKGGSTFKIFTMVAALEKGYPLDFNIVAVSPYKSPIYTAAANDIAACPDKKHWCPRNASAGMNGPRNMWTGFGMSVNTFFVPLQEKVGADAAIATAQRMGIKFRESNDIRFTTTNPKFFGPFTIGVSSTVPLELANAYATLAADGKYCQPIPVTQILDRKGEEISEIAEPRCVQEITPEVARAAIDAARCPIYDRGGLGKCGGGTTGSYFVGLDGKGGKTVAQAIGHPAFGKTGTSDFNWTANLAVSTKQLTVAATLANPDFAETKHDAEAPRRANRAATHTLRDAMADLESIQFDAPPQELVVGKRVRIPDVTCKSVGAATSALKGAGFDVMVPDERIDSTCPAGTVAKSDPSGSTSKGSTVMLYISNGNPPPGDDEPPGPPGPPGG